MLAKILVLAGLFTTSGRAAEQEPIPRLFDQVVSRGERSIHFTLVIFNQANFALRLIDNAAPHDQPRFPDLETAMRASGCVAGCNGGFFVRKPFEPFGLMISGGKSFGTFDPNSWLNALLVLRAGQPAAFEPSPSLKDRTQIESLLQTGPWLVHRGDAVPALDALRQARRTFVCHDSHGTWALGVCDACSLRELAVSLKDPAFVPALEVVEAINLDGGPSTGLWAKQVPDNFYLREGWPVRNYLGIVPRS